MSQRIPMDPSVDPANRKPDCPVTGAIGSLHLLCLFAPFCFSLTGLALVGAGWFFSTIGITMGYHRLFTHMSFETYRWIKISLAILGTLSWQGGPIRWVGVHRLHHKDSDGPADPHTPRHGFFWSHVVWTLYKDGNGFEPYKVTGDLQEDKVLVFIDRYFWVPHVLLAIALTVAGYWYGGTYYAVSWFVYGIAVRTVLVYHGTWLINSATHVWGYRNFQNTGDNSRNLWWIALPSLGEGWHNNHHGKPRSAWHGMRWFEIDVTGRLIWVLAVLGLAWNVKDGRPALSELMRNAPSRRGLSQSIDPK